MTDILELSTRQLIAVFNSRALSPVEYMSALISRIEASEPKVQALWLFRPEQALEDARASEDRYLQNAPKGRLDGVPVTVKELIATKGDHVPQGTAAITPFAANEDAPTAARLREDGAVIYAKTTCPDYGMLSSGLSSFHQLSRNPWDLTQNPGGSSSGSGAAGAAGYGRLHVGTDIGGSIRIPAGWTGLFGLKPSFGRVPIDPYYTGRVAGPMTPTVDDAAILMQTITRPDWRDATSLKHENIDWDTGPVELRGMKIGLMMEGGCGNPVHPEITEAVQNAARLFEGNGATVIPVAPVVTREMLDGLGMAWAARVWSMISKLEPGAQERILPYIRDWAATGADVSGPEVAAGFEQVFAMRRAANKALHGLDAIISPVNPDRSYPAELPSPTNDPQRNFEHIAFTVPWNMGEQPAASVHCGMTSTGIPIGLQIVGPRFEDLAVLRIARTWEEMRGPITDWPRFDRP